MQENPSVSNYSQRITGTTQGTTYEVKLVDTNTSVSKKEIDSVLHDFDLELSGYIDESILSKINRGSLKKLPKKSIYFRKCFITSQEISKISGGAFDPTVFPLVKAWGFFKKPYEVPTEDVLDSLMENVGFHNLAIQNDSIIKYNDKTTLDFNAIAQGYSVDIIGDFLKLKGHTNFYIEIGGEVLVNGKKEDGNPWYLAIDYPSKENKEGETRMAKAVIGIDENKAIATSGNYRKVFEFQGKQYAHTLNPKTGKPAQNNTRSVTVIANSCMDADAYATVFMVLGVEKSMTFLRENDSLPLQAYFLYDDDGKIVERMTDGFQKYLLEQ